MFMINTTSETKCKKSTRSKVENVEAIVVVPHTSGFENWTKRVRTRLCFAVGLLHVRLE